MLVGRLSINPDFFAGWSFTIFKEYFDKQKWRDQTGESVEKVAKLLNIEIPKKKGEEIAPE
jgi:hypothetical protein